ncbi:glycoside hydrolase family 31 protein [Schizophyllum amplum]|uniref:Glucosidase II subunit alpha n=1 Tax=Schizophyllum amplum TaxID=97359 RepID=A0A550CVU4_9AGAR|nr:glycoside hydrolase family 31 protein [Auriculariopsis ampla]
MRVLTLLGIAASLALVPDALAVKEKDFKTCSQSGFCRRGRALAARAKEASSWNSPYSVDASSVAISPDQASVTAGVKSLLYPEVKFELELRVHDDGVVRVRMDEVGGLKKRYDEASSWALIAEPVVSKTVQWTAAKDCIRAVYGPKKELEVVVSYEPLRVALLRNGKAQVQLNGHGLLHMEHFRTKEERKIEETSQEEEQVVLDTTNPRAWFEGDSEDGWWDEKFGGHTDTKPKGPESLSLDISFPFHPVVYGIPQHATTLALPTTLGDDATYTDPFRLHNADVFEYLASSPMSLYGSIPVMYAHSEESTVGVFNAVASETWIDIWHAKPQSSDTHWMSESGILDVFLLPGPTPADVFAQYGRLTGTAAMPAQWSLGYHQCRWNYVSSDDVRMVSRKMDEHDMPMDVIWLDIEYSEEHKYFIWDHKTFPDPVDMTKDVAAVGRKMVVIIDPHLKRTSNYPVYQEATERGLTVRKPNGQDEYEGWCWAGSSSWLDCFNPGSWKWYQDLYLLDRKREDGGWTWAESTEDVHIWNDMNEPAIFNGPEITMPKDMVHYGGWEHRDVHNINGMLFTNQTWQALKARSTPAKRPFVLTRSFYAGSQRWGAMWTGDNLGTWEHMAVGLKMVLANSIGGMPFAGSDVGGFFGNPEPEMLVRWYQLGAFNPFFRAHAHIDTKRREPYLLDEPYRQMLKDILRLRYAQLPIWYTAFHQSAVTGVPILRPHWVMFPKDVNGFALDDQFFVGDSGLLVKPITTPETTEASVYLPAEDQIYYNYFTHLAYRSSKKGKTVTVPAALSEIPLLIRGGSIVPTRERPRRSAPLMKHDPFTLRVALDKAGAAAGTLYLDDGETYAFEQGDFVYRDLAAETKSKVLRISSRDLAASPRLLQVGREVSLDVYSPGNAYAKEIAGVRVERVVVLGAGKPKKVTLGDGGRELVWEFVPGVAAGGKKEGTASVLTIKDPKALIVEDWDIVITL